MPRTRDTIACAWTHMIHDPVGSKFETAGRGGGMTRTGSKDFLQICFMRRLREATPALCWRAIKMLGGLMGLALAVGLASAQPVNDNLTDATLLTGPSGAVLGSNVGATKEPGEPNHAGAFGGASIWYSWTAPADGTVIFDTAGSID